MNHFEKFLFTKTVLSLATREIVIVLSRYILPWISRAYSQDLRSTRLPSLARALSFPSTLHASNCYHSSIANQIVVVLRCSSEKFGNGRNQDHKVSPDCTKTMLFIRIFCCSMKLYYIPLTLLWKSKRQIVVVKHKVIFLLAKNRGNLSSFDSIYQINVKSGKGKLIRKIWLEVRQKGAKKSNSICLFSYFWGKNYYCILHVRYFGKRLFPPSK